jgi:DNA-binding IscR family transcriptional regulator
VLAAVDEPVALDHLALDAEPEAVVELWLALRATIRDVLERVTLADLARNALPEDLRRLAQVERRRLPPIGETERADEDHRQGRLRHPGGR